ncbi:hypothetical protein PAE9249_01677 [Paenibacillus sp. CECT 9249]|uniref:hypothetical protein n=1 Tax=Paenibacillus sp. CECT 9249 TaxID=2845385 RepID=UPI001E31DF30|nr:hypothetical protein [Paenibacillus sp. CECT 9249]CAH0119178.1 hypothetical protein PAE9249_01677 [Paenibacillus sp. CECT 9249]
MNDKAALIQNGMTTDEVNQIPTAALQSKMNDTTRLGYYIEEKAETENEEAAIDLVKVISKANINDVKMKDLAFYLLNTTATIQLQVSGNKLTGQIDDADQTNVQYRVFLNDEIYYPESGQFTPLAPSPLDISLYLSEKELKFGQENKLRVEFQDYWGQTDVWETTFVGTYSGIMFMDETGNYYSDTFGGILKYLDFGVIVAGQTTIDQRVQVKNQLGYGITNLTLEAQNVALPDGVRVELSRKNKPFIGEDKLLFSQILQEDDVVEFYVRISTDIEARPVPNGEFEIRARADKV